LNLSLSILSVFDRLRDRVRRKKWTLERANGVRGEDLAMRFLQRKKFTVVARNYKPRTGRGEIDLICWDRDTLVFVEVKAAETDERGTPDRVIDRYKRETIERAARAYVSLARVPWERVRFDIVTVLGTDRHKIEHFPGAFG
jgi:putative endonuclease